MGDFLDEVVILIELVGAFRRRHNLQGYTRRAIGELRSIMAAEEWGNIILSILTVHRSTFNSAIPHDYATQRSVCIAASFSVPVSRQETRLMSSVRMLCIETCIADLAPDSVDRNRSDKAASHCNRTEGPTSP